MHSGYINIIRFDLYQISVVGKSFVIPHRLRPHLRHLLRGIAGPTTLASAATHYEIVCPEEVAELHPAVFLEGQLERVTAVSKFSTIQYQIAAASGPTAIHAPTIAFHIPSAALVDGSIYSGRLRHFVAPKEITSSSSRPIEIDVAPLASNMIGTQFFGHWLTDDCTQYLLGEAYGSPLCLQRPAYRDQSAYEAYFKQDWTPISSARVKDLIIFQDFSQNSHKKRRYQVLSGRLRTYFATREPSLLLYLRRGSTGVFRPISNEDQLIQILLKQGFIVADIQSDSVEELLEKLVNAKIVVSLEGSHIAHCCFSLPEGAGLVVLSIPSKFTAVHRGWTEARSIRFGFIIGSETDDGYRYEPKEVLQTLELMFKALSVD
jgi:hypothetical protein